MLLNKADIHIHSDFSDSSASVESILDFAVKNEFKVIAITDHNTIEGALLAKNLVETKKINLDVIVGEEISSLDGHIVGLFLNKKINPGQTVFKTIMDIKRQGGIVITPHPFFRTNVKKDGNEIGGIGFKNIQRYKNYIDALEVANGNLTMYFSENKKAKIINRNNFYLSETGGSDTHFLSAVGVSHTLFYGETALDLKNCILSKKTVAVQGKWSALSILEYIVLAIKEGSSFIGYIIKLNLDEITKKILNFIYCRLNINPGSNLFTPIFKPKYQKYKDC